MDCTVFDYEPRLFPVWEYMESLGLMKDDVIRPRSPLASIQLYRECCMVFCEVFSVEHLKRVSKGSWKIIQFSEYIIRDFHAALRSFPGARSRVVVHDTKQFFDIRKIQENIRNKRDCNRFIVWISPRKADEHDYQITNFGEPSKAGPLPWSPAEMRDPWEQIDEDPHPCIRSAFRTPPWICNRPSEYSMRKGFWSDDNDRIPRSMLRPTLKMDTRAAYDVLTRIAVHKGEFASFEKYFALNAVSLINLIGIGGFGIAMAVKNTQKVVSVLKLVPLCEERVTDVLREVFISAQLSNYKAVIGKFWGFPKFHGCAVVSDSLNADILSFLEGYEESESFMQPDINKWLVIQIEYGGNSLRHYARAPEGHLMLEHYGCALSILAQVLQTLAEAEELCSFEHRDCHWENILIFEDLSESQKRTEIMSLGTMVSLPSFGLKAMLIDFGLSRCRTPHGLEYFDVNRMSPDVLQQSGTVQYEIYRKMHEIVGDSWDKFHPHTNALWIDYLVDKLLHRVGYKDEYSPQYSMYRGFIERFKRSVQTNEFFEVTKSAQGYRARFCYLFLKLKRRNMTLEENEFFVTSSPESAGEEP